MDKDLQIRILQEENKTLKELSHNQQQMIDSYKAIKENTEKMWGIHMLFQADYNKICSSYEGCQRQLAKEKEDNKMLRARIAELKATIN
ncbi:MAG TPA: hypothetical protein VIK74_05340 [Parasegetibacter sp.]|jgi:hypothetical protein